jgi:flagellar hook assembly protein FlgD
LVTNPKGVPLCRNTATSWTSKLAAWGAGCGCRASGSFPKESIILSSDCISPNFDGHQDDMQILIRSPFSKAVAELKVLDEIGIPVRHLLQDEFMGTEHAMSWDGTNGSGERLRIGLYFFWLQLRSEGGQTNSMYKAFSVCR